MEKLTPAIEYVKQIFKEWWTLLLAGVVIGLLLFATMRLVFYTSEATHYHANFAVYINGEREQFKSFAYYEEIQACSAENNSPRARVHMHENINDVVHVHDMRVTWGNFFENIGWTLGTTLLSDGEDVYINGQDGKTLQFVLNGESVTSVNNTVIGNEDRLVVSYGTPDVNVDSLYETVAQTAHEVNSKPDPAACAGLNGTSSNSFMDRLKHAVDITK